MFDFRKIFNGLGMKTESSRSEKAQISEINKLHDRMLSGGKSDVSYIKQLHLIVSKSSHGSVWNHGLTILSDIKQGYNNRNGGAITSAAGSALRNLKKEYLKKFK